MTTALDLDAIEAAAKAATPGPWAWESVGEKCNHWCLGSTDPPVAGEIVEEYDEAARRYLPKPEVVDFVCESQDNLDNARFITAASPDVVWALVARLRAAEALIISAGLDPRAPRCVSLEMNVAREAWLALRSP